MAETTSLGLHAPVGADPQEPSHAGTRDTDPTDVAILAEQLNLLIPQPGFIQATAASAAPTGWLLADGASVLRTGYPKLFTAIGTTYGSVDGTHFNVPDLRGRVPVGVDGSAGRLSSSDALGNSSGEETHGLSVAEMPTHNHTPGAGTNFLANNGTAIASAAGSSVYAGQDVAPATANKGGGASHNNMQPYQVVNWLVKT